MLLARRSTACLLVAVTTLVAACTPTRNTIGGYTAAQLAEAERTAREQCERRGTTGLPPNRFTTDGCTLWPDCKWQDCCVDHDKVYWCGGSAEDRSRADAELRKCVADRGYPIIAEIMRWTVRASAASWLPVPWRWGYGWPWPHGYDGGQ